MSAPKSEHAVSVTFGDLNPVVQELILPHEWDNKNPSEQRDWALLQVAAFEAQNRQLREALQTLVDQGEPLRAQFELWSNWQPRVKEWQAVRAALAATEPKP